MKALLTAVFALTLTVPALAQTAAPAETKDGATVPPTATYEQAFTECAEATKDAVEKADAVKTCMLEKGHTLNNEAAPAAAVTTETKVEGVETTTTTTTEKH